MSNRRYIIGTGYSTHTLGVAGSERFYSMWLSNTLRFAKPQDIYLVVPMSEFWVQTEGEPGFYPGGPVHVIRTQANLGHNHDLPPNRVLGGWSMGFLLGAMMAMHAGDDVDFIYKEQDCLAFGPWVDRLYEDLGEADFVAGKVNTNNHAVGLRGQSLVLLRAEAIRKFIALYMSVDAPERGFNTEQKMDYVARYLPMAETSMGYDRTRPIKFDDDAFYAQQWTESELAELNKRGLV